MLPKIAKMIDDKVSPLVNKISSLDVNLLADALLPKFLKLIDEKVTVLMEKISLLTDDVNRLKSENTKLKADVAQYESRIDQLEEYTRIDNLIIKGIPEDYSTAVKGFVTSSESGTVVNRENPDTTLASVLQFCQSTLQIDVTAADISVTHRLPKNLNDKYQPIIVRFTNRRARNLVYASRQRLKSIHSTTGPVYINEQLTRKNDRLVASCRRLWKNGKIAGTWTWNGLVYIKHLSPNGGRTLKVTDESVIADLN